MTVTTGNTELLDIARDAALTAGRLVRQRRAEGVTVAASKSSQEDIVTEADRESEALIRSILATARPNDGFLGEESGADAGSSGLTWVVDPIDGTVNYLYGIPHYAVSIAVVEGDPDPASWRALAAAVVNPAIGEVFTATAGGGAYLGTVPIRVAQATELSQCLVGTGFAYSATKRMEQAAIVATLIGQVRDIRRMGTASLDLCSVACGRLNAYYERGLRPWDHAAGALVAREAGAAVHGPRGMAATEELILAAEPSVAAELERLIDALSN
ncbi:MAG: inositol monophosphatase family protein [Lacisediminihabitans sp.]